jgi:hypothetical protein
MAFFFKMGHALLARRIVKFACIIIVLSVPSVIIEHISLKIYAILVCRCVRLVQMEHPVLIVRLVILLIQMQLPHHV